MNYFLCCVVYLLFFCATKSVIGACTSEQLDQWRCGSQPDNGDHASCIAHCKAYETLHDCAHNVLEDSTVQNTEESKCCLTCKNVGASSAGDGSGIMNSTTANPCDDQLLHNSCATDLPHCTDSTLTEAPRDENCCRTCIPVVPIEHCGSAVNVDQISELPECTAGVHAQFNGCNYNCKPPAPVRECSVSDRDACLAIASVCDPNHVNVAQVCDDSVSCCCMCKHSANTCGSAAQFVHNCADVRYCEHGETPSVRNGSVVSGTKACCPTCRAMRAPCPQCALDRECTNWIDSSDLERRIGYCVENHLVQEKQICLLADGDVRDAISSYNADQLKLYVMELISRYCASGMHSSSIISSSTNNHSPLCNSHRLRNFEINMILVLNEDFAESLCFHARLVRTDAVVKSIPSDHTSDEHFGHVIVEVPRPHNEDVPHSPTGKKRAEEDDDFGLVSEALGSSFTQDTAGIQSASVADVSSGVSVISLSCFASFVAILLSVFNAVA